MSFLNKNEDKGKSVAVIVPAQHVLDGGGAAQVFKLQIETLKTLNCSVILIVAAPTFKLNRAARKRWLCKIELAAKKLCADEIIIISQFKYLRTLTALPSILTAKVRGCWNLNTDILLNKILNERQLRSKIRTMPFAVLCNYCSGLSLANAIIDTKRQILILHDVADNEVSTSTTDILDLIPNIVLLSADEMSQLQPKLRYSKCHIGLPLPSQKSLDFIELLSYSTLAEALDDSDPELAPNETDWKLASSLDLLFVGGAHPPNIEGLKQFVETCFTPYLQPKDIRLVVAGAAGPALWGNGPIPEGVTMLGTVANLRPLYASAKLVVVPLLSGTGISIKTLEALTLGKPVFASPVGLRGLAAPEDCSFAPPFDVIWAQQIVSLLKSRLPRKTLRDRLYTGFIHPTLATTLSNILQTLGDLPTPPEAMDPLDNIRPERLPLVEWVGDIKHILDIPLESQLNSKLYRERLRRLLNANFQGCDYEDILEDLKKIRY